MQMLIFLLVFTSILVLGHVYIGKRLIKPHNLSPVANYIIWTVILTSPICVFLTFILRVQNINGIIVDITGWIGFLGMGFFSLIIAFLIIKDLSFLVIKIIDNNSQKKTYNPDRRAFLMTTINYSILGTSALLTGYGFYEARRIPGVEEVTVYLPDLPLEFEGYRMTQFTDLHVGPTIKQRFVQSVVNQLNSLNADAIVFTGDLVDGQVPSLRKDVSPLAELSAQDGVYFVTGNHEYYSGAQSWIEEVTRLGMNVLLDSHKIISKNNRNLIMAGVTDFNAKSMVPDHISDPFKALSGAPDSDVKILLAHQPKNIYKAAEAGFDLQISGHTHGGQYFPWRYMVTLSQPYVVGLHKHASTWIYVSRGTGYWGPPLRLGVPSEITLLTLSSQNPPDTI